MSSQPYSSVLSPSSSSPSPSPDNPTQCSPPAPLSSRPNGCLTYEIKNGYLFRQSGLLKSWAMRWYLCRDRMLFKCHSLPGTIAEGIASPSRIMLLINCKIRVLDKPSRPFSFQIYNPTTEQTLTLAATSKTDMDHWVESLCACIAGLPAPLPPSALLEEHMAAMVADELHAVGWPISSNPSLPLSTSSSSLSLVNSKSHLSHSSSTLSTLSTISTSSATIPLSSTAISSSPRQTSSEETKNGDEISSALAFPTQINRTTTSPPKSSYNSYSTSVPVDTSVAALTGPNLINALAVDAVTSPSSDQVNFLAVVNDRKVHVEGLAQQLSVLLKELAKVQDTLLLETAGKQTAEKKKATLLRQVSEREKEIYYLTSCASAHSLSDTSLSNSLTPRLVGGTAPTDTAVPITSISPISSLSHGADDVAVIAKEVSHVLSHVSHAVDSVLSFATGGTSLHTPSTLSAHVNSSTSTRSTMPLSSSSFGSSFYDHDERSVSSHGPDSLHDALSLSNPLLQSLPASSHAPGDTESDASIVEKIRGAEKTTMQVCIMGIVTLHRLAIYYGYNIPCPCAIARAKTSSSSLSSPSSLVSSASLSSQSSVLDNRDIRDGNMVRKNDDKLSCNSLLWCPPSLHDADAKRIRTLLPVPQCSDDLDRDRSDNDSDNDNVNDNLTDCKHMATQSTASLPYQKLFLNRLTYALGSMQKDIHSSIENLISVTARVYTTTLPHDLDKSLSSPSSPVSPTLSPIALPTSSTHILCSFRPFPSSFLELVSPTQLRLLETQHSLRVSPSPTSGVTPAEHTSSFSNASNCSLILRTGVSLLMLVCDAVTTLAEAAQDAAEERSKVVKLTQVKAKLFQQQFKREGG